MNRIRTKTSSLAFVRYQLQRAILENVLENNYTKDDREAGLQFFGGCAFCGAPEAPRNDHLVPVIRCGDFVRDNVVPACAKCDDSRGKQDFREWMRQATSPGSLRHRGLTDVKIEGRIRRIEQWQAGYQPRTDEQLFGKNFIKYQDILREMGALCEQARELVNDVRSESTTLIAPDANHLKFSKHGQSIADSIRWFVLGRYVTAARARGDKTIVIRAGDVHSQMGLQQQYPNVCQVLRGNKLSMVANVKLISTHGPPVGANTCFTYQL